MWSILPVMGKYTDSLSTFMILCILPFDCNVPVYRVILQLKIVQVSCLYLFLQLKFTKRNQKCQQWTMCLILTSQHFMLATTKAFCMHKKLQYLCYRMIFSLCYCRGNLTSCHIQVKCCFALGLLLHIHEITVLRNILLNM